MVTYYLDEVINLITLCETRDELDQLAAVIDEEKQSYSLRVLKEINTAFIMKRVELKFTGF